MKYSVDFTVRLRGESAHMLEQLVKNGYCASKTEAVRAAVIRYALEMGLLSGSQLFARTAKRINARGYTDEEIQRQIDAVKEK